MVEAGFVVAGVSIITIILTKFKFFYVKNGDWSCACGFVDKDKLWDEDEVEIKYFELSDNVKRDIYEAKRPYSP